MKCVVNYDLSDSRVEYDCENTLTILTLSMQYMVNAIILPRKKKTKQ